MDTVSAAVIFSVGATAIFAVAFLIAHFADDVRVVSPGSAEAHSFDCTDSLTNSFSNRNNPINNHHWDE